MSARLRLVNSTLGGTCTPRSAVRGPVDQQHGSAHVGQQHRRQRRRADAGELHDLHVRKRSHGGQSPDADGPVTARDAPQRQAQAPDCCVAARRTSRGLNPGVRSVNPGVRSLSPGVRSLSPGVRGLNRPLMVSRHDAIIMLATLEEARAAHLVARPGCSGNCLPCPALPRRGGGAARARPAASRARRPRCGADRWSRPRIGSRPRDAPRTTSPSCCSAWAAPRTRSPACAKPPWTIQTTSPPGSAWRTCWRSPGARGEATAVLVAFADRAVRAGDRALVRAGNRSRWWRSTPTIPRCCGWQTCCTWRAFGTMRSACWRSACALRPTTSAPD